MVAVLSINKDKKITGPICGPRRLSVVNSIILGATTSRLTIMPLHSQNPTFKHPNSDNILPSHPGPKSLLVVSDSALSKKCTNFDADSGFEKTTLVTVVYVLIFNSF